MVEKYKIIAMIKDNKKIIITGACGFVGSNIANRLFSLGYNIYCLDNLEFGNEKNLNIVFYKSGFEFLTEEDLAPFDILIHCATSNIIYSIDHPIETFQNNATNTIKLFQKFKGKIIYTSTASVYGQSNIIPTHEDAEIKTYNAYDQSKYIAELFLKSRGNYTTLRLSNVYGKNQRPDNPFCGVMGKIIDSALTGNVFKINGNGSQTRDYTAVDDVINAIISSIDQESKNTEINIASGKETSINQLINIVEKITEKNIRVKYIDSRKIDNINRRCLDVSKAKRILKWQPEIFIDEGIKDTIAWMTKKK